jgi:hypothetical protein
LINGAVQVCTLESDQIWQDYIDMNMDHNVVDLRFLNFVDSKIYILEYPTSKIHEFIHQEIFRQLNERSRYVNSLGTATINGRAPDLIISPSSRCPRSVTPQGISRSDFITLIVEIGYAQDWPGIHGLDAKAEYWFNNRVGLEYIIAVKVYRMNNVLSNCEYKVWDIRAMNGIFTANVPLVNFFAGNHNIFLDSRRILGIPTAEALPAHCPPQMRINMSRIRNNAIDEGY